MNYSTIFQSSEENESLKIYIHLILNETFWNVSHTWRLPNITQDILNWFHLSVHDWSDIIELRDVQSIFEQNFF
jgi:hypothetical protein